jgi:hypothetical protein
VCLLDRNQLEVAVLELHVAHSAVRAQRTQGLSVGADGQTARVAGAQDRCLANVHALAFARFDQSRH